MASIVASWSWRVLNKGVYVWSDMPEKDFSIILKLSKWEPMRYGVSNPFMIDFPGEYEHDGIVVRCRESWDQLHYILRFEDSETVALLFNPKSVDHDALKSVQNYFCIDTDTKERIEQNEFEWEVMLFDQ